MNEQPYFMYSLLNRKAYENIELRHPGAEFLDLVRLALPSGWEVSVGGFWTQVSISGGGGVDSGWKIHVSATIADGYEVLRKVLPCVVKNKVCFKFLSDEFALRLSLSKNMPRMQVGKFITIYPQSVEQCQLIVEELDALTKGHVGPYVLTDQAVSESKNVYVRFGAHTANYKLDRYGRHVPGYRDGNGRWNVDRRGLSDFGGALPWENNQACINQKAGDIGPVKIGGCYSINKAIRYNGSGGIYHGVDERSDMPVVVREQRRGLDGFSALPGDESGSTIKKEARVLQIVEKSGLTPRYIDHFEEGEHWFLVQERFVEADTLWGYAMQVYFGTLDMTGREIFERIKLLFLRVASGLKTIHSQSVVLRDLTRTNVLVTKEEQIRFIDLEFAHVIGDESPWVHGWTPGYGSPQQQNGDAPSIKDDCYAFGVLLLDGLTFCASGLELDRVSVLRRLKRNLHDLMFPEQLEEIISGLLDEDMEKRWNLDRAIQSLQSMSFAGVDTPVFPTSALPINIKNNIDDDRRLCRKTLDGVNEFLRSSATYSRHDRLWPASPQVWILNPVCIGYGASGVALYQQKAGVLESKTLNWIIERTGPKTCPSGFFAGMAGVSWLLAECGQLSLACQILDQAWDASDDVGSSLYFGFAGIGLVALKLFQATGDRRHLERAEECAFKIQEESQEGENGVYWFDSGQIKLGFAEGQSGIALFFLYLYHATGNLNYLAFGRKALDFDLAHRQDISGQVLWYPQVNALPHDPKTPYLWAGTAGVGAVLLRYYYLTRDLKYGALLSRLGSTISTRFSNKIWQSEGLAGMIEFHLDMAYFFPEHSLRHISIAWHLAEGIMDHVIALDEDSFKGLAFAGVEHVRICSDYGHGTAGIAMCLHRLLHGGCRCLFLDEIFNVLPNTKKSAESSEVLHED